jgi:uncharacterized protein YkwD
MKFTGKGLVAALALGAAAVLAQPVAGQAGPSAREVDIQAQTGQLFALANQARAAAGVGPLKWDPALAAAALSHCQTLRIIAKTF